MASSKVCSRHSDLGRVRARDSDHTLLFPPVTMSDLIVLAKLIMEIFS